MIEIDANACSRIGVHEGPTTPSNYDLFEITNDVYGATVSIEIMRHIDDDLWSTE